MRQIAIRPGSASPPSSVASCRAAKTPASHELEQARAEGLAVIDELLTSLMPAARWSSARHVEAAAKLLERRARLNGTDRPIQVEAEVNHTHTGTIEDEIAELERSLGLNDPSLAGLAPLDP